MLAVPFDTLKLARALRDRAGFSQEHAEAAADALAEVLGEQVATKQDIKDITSWSGLRNHAAHGEWDLVSDRRQVDLMLQGVEAVTTLRVSFIGDEPYLDSSTVERKPLGSSP